MFLLLSCRVLYLLWAFYHAYGFQKFSSVGHRFLSTMRPRAMSIFCDNLFVPGGWHILYHLFMNFQLYVYIFKWYLKTLKFKMPNINYKKNSSPDDENYQFYFNLHSSVFSKCFPLKYTCLYQKDINPAHHKFRLEKKFHYMKK